MNTTVIIPNYNGIDYLKKCIASLNKSNYKDFEVIVVDNGSADGSADWMKAEHPEIRLISLKENLGFAPAVNLGIEAAFTKYVLLLNNDTEVDPDMVERLEKAIDEDEKIFSVSAKMLSLHDPELIDGAGDYYCALGWAYAYGKGKKVSEKCLKKKEIFSACAGCAIYRRDILIEIGRFDERHFAYLEDVDLGYRARINGYVNLYEPEAVCLHAGSAFSGSRYNEFKIDLSSRNNVYLIWKNMPLFQLLLNLPFLLVGFLIKILFFILKGYGKTYLKGLVKGVKMSLSKDGRRKKVPFRWKNLPCLIKIQIELWIGIIRRFC